MKARRPLPPAAPLALALAVLLVPGCHDGGGDDGKTSFAGFVREQIEGNTADDVDPVPLDGIDFSFTEDPDAFDDLLP